MEDYTDVLDEMINLDYDEDEQKKLDEKFKPKTQVDINEPFYKGAMVIVRISQILSVTLGIGVCLHMAEKFPSFAPIIFGVCLILLCVNEVFKNMAITEISSIGIINEGKSVKLSSKPYRTALFFLVAFSVATSFIGGPVVIKKFSEHKPLIILDSIRYKFMAEIENHKKEFTSQKAEAFAVAANIHEQSSYAGKTSKEVRDEKAKILVLGVGKDSLMNSVVLSTSSKMDIELSNAENENKAIVKEHSNWCEDTGKMSSFIAVGLDLIVFILLGWCINHQSRKRKENKNKKELQKSLDNSSKGVGKDSVSQLLNDKDKEKTPLYKEGVSAPENGGANLVTVKLVNGELKTYQAGDFRSYHYGSSKTRQATLKPLLDELNKLEAIQETLKNKLP